MPSRRRSPCGSNASKKTFAWLPDLKPGQQVRLEQHLDTAALPLAAVDLQRHLRPAVDLQHHAGGQQDAKRHDDQQAEVRRAGHFADRDRHHRTALFVGLLLLHFADFGRLLARTAAAHRPVFELPLGELALGRRSLARRCLLRRSLALRRLLLWRSLALGRLLLRRRGRLLALLGERCPRPQAHGRHQRDGGELPTSASHWFEFERLWHCA